MQGVLQPVSLPLSVPAQVTVFCPSKEKALHPFGNRSGPHYAQEIPAGMQGEDQRETAAGKVETQAGLGWEVCRALIPRTEGLILTRQALARGFGLTHMCCCGRLSCFVLCSEFSHFGLSYPKMTVLWKPAPFWTMPQFKGQFLHITFLHYAAPQKGRVQGVAPG